MTLFSRYKFDILILWRGGHRYCNRKVGHIGLWRKTSIASIGLQFAVINPLFVVLPGPRPGYVARWTAVTVIMCLARLFVAPTNFYIYCTCAPVRRPSHRVALIFPHYRTHDSTILPPVPRFPLMSHTNPTSTSSNFQLIFDNALKAYKKRTKNDLLTHPLADRLKDCDSASSILAVFQELVQELNQSQRSNMKWLDPTVNVLHAFSETLGEGVGSVCLRTLSCPRSTLSHLFDRYSLLQRLFL